MKVISRGRAFRGAKSMILSSPMEVWVMLRFYSGIVVLGGGGCVDISGHIQ